MHRSIAAAALLLATTVAPAQTVYRCVQPGKPVVLQSGPCAHPARSSVAARYDPRGKTSRRPSDSAAAAEAAKRLEDLAKARKALTGKRHPPGAIK